MKFLFLALLSTAGLAATTDTLLLKGEVPEIVAIVVTPTVLATNLPLETTQANGYVADVNTKWNTTGGARVEVSSANAGLLQHDTDPLVGISYTLQTTRWGTFSLATPQTFDDTAAGIQDVTEALGISYTGVAHELRLAGTYTDTVTFTISAI